MSSITFAGNLTADPDLRITSNGRAVARFTVIENRRRRAEDGQGWEDAEPNAFRVEVWGPLAENVAESCGKGDRVHVSGSFITDRWEDKETREVRTASHVKAEEVSFSLRYHTVRATKASRTSARAHDDSESGQEG